uniref:TPR_REGION domain-containing protein n=1 Tax=Strongyloides papillosus TaxID=174720 RepID=A0A0N5B6J7_STREA
MSLMNEMIDNVKQLVKDKQFKDAIIQAENLFGYQVDDYNLFMFTANAYLQTENYEKCYEMLKKGIRMKPENKTGYAGILKLYLDKRIPGNNDIKKYIETLIKLDSKNTTKMDDIQKALKNLYIELKDFEALGKIIENDSTLVKELLEGDFLNQMSEDFFLICVRKIFISDEIDLRIENLIKIKEKILEFNIELDKKDYDKLMSKILDQEVKDKFQISLALALDLISFIMNEWYEVETISAKYLANLNRFYIMSSTDDCNTFISYQSTLELLKEFVNDDYSANSQLASKYLTVAKSPKATVFPLSAALLSLFCLTHNHLAADELIRKIFHTQGGREQLFDRTLYLYYGAYLECHWFLDSEDKVLLLDDSSLSNKAIFFSRLFQIECSAKENVDDIIDKSVKSFSNNQSEIRCIFEYLGRKKESKDVLKVQSKNIISALIPILCKRGFDVPISELNDIIASLKNLLNSYPNQSYLLFCIGMIIRNKYPREAWACFSSIFPKLYFNHTLTKAMIEMSEILVIPKSQIVNVMDSYYKYGPTDHTFIVKYCKILVHMKNFDELKNCLSIYFQKYANYNDTKDIISLNEYQQLKMMWAISFKELGLYRKALTIIDHVYKDDVNHLEEWVVIKLTCYVEDKKLLDAIKFYEDEAFLFISSNKIHGLALYSYLQLLTITPPFSKQKILCLKGIYGILYNPSISFEKSYQLLVSSARHYLFLELAFMNNTVIKEISLPLISDSNENLKSLCIDLAFNETLSILETCFDNDITISIEHLREIVRCLIIKYNQEKNAQYLEIALECLTSMEGKADDSMLFEVLLTKSIVLLFVKRFDESKKILRRLTEMNVKALKPWLLLFVIEVLSEKINNENVVKLVETCVTMNNDDPMVPIMVVIAALNNSHSGHDFECEAWECLFRQIVQSSIRGQTLTVVELFSFFRLMKPNQFDNNYCDSEMQDFWYAFKSHMVKKYINYGNEEDEFTGKFLRAFAALELNDINYAEEIFSEMSESDNELIKTVKALTLAINKLQHGGTKTDALDELKKAPLLKNVEKTLDNLNVSNDNLPTNIITLLKSVEENDTEMFKCVFTPKYASLILCYIYSKKLNVSNEIFEAMEKYPANILVQCNPYDNLDVKKMIEIEGGYSEKGAELVTESEGDKILLEKTLYLKLMYLKEQYETD